MKSRILGIDYGVVRIGLALSDESKLIALSLPTFRAQKKLQDTAKSLIAYLETVQKEKNCQIEKIVIGMPLLMSGKKGFMADEVAEFVELLRGLTTIPIVLWDERLTTSQAERSLKESSLTRKRRSQVVDSVAAIIILQNFLDSLSN